MQPLIAIPAILALLYRAHSRKSLTPLGLVVAAITASVHALHPWSVFFALLGVFFLAGTAVTKVKHDVKARLTHSSSGATGGEGPRTHTQVLANSIVASGLILLHAWKLAHEPVQATTCWGKGHDVLVVGIIANYAAVASDTFSSELGILSPTPPRLLTSLSPPLRPVPRGTNGGVTATGLLAGLGGSFLIALTATSLTPFCSGAAGNAHGWSLRERVSFTLTITAVGLMGSLLDSVMGGVLQASVVDVRSGKIVEGEGGRKVLIASSSNISGERSPPKSQEVSGAKDSYPGSSAGKPSRKVENGWDILSNNGVNFAMAASISMGAIVGACWVWELPVFTIIQ